MASLQLWLKGLVAAAIGGCFGAVASAYAIPTAVNFSHDGLINMAKVAGAGALLMVAGYLKQSPLPSNVKPPTS